MEYKLRDYQEKCHQDTLDWMKNGGKAGVVVNPTGCHEPGYRVFLQSGELKKVEDIQVGDMLAGINETYREVLSLIKGRGKMFKITLKRTNISFIVNEDHILHLHRTQIGDEEKERYYKPIVNVSVKEYLNWAKSRKHLYKIVRSGIFLPPTSETLPIEPYFLGLWLGDGSSKAPSITTMDTEVVEYLENFALSINHKIRVSYKENNKANTYHLTRDRTVGQDGRYPNYLKNKLNNLGIINNKRIPSIYSSASFEERVKLLEGLIDSDGYDGGQGIYSITQKSKDLTLDIYYLTGSLGLNPRIHISKKRCLICKNKDLREYFTVSFNAELFLQPKLPRKNISNNRINISNKINSFRYGFSIEEVGEGDFYGFELDGDNLYIDENFIIQHNSGKSLQISQLTHEYDGGVIVLSPNKEILEQNYEKYLSYGGEGCIYSASMNSKEMCHATFATLGSVKKLGKEFKKLGISLLIQDESHLHSNPEGGMFKDFLRDLSPKHILGYTASPFRLKNYTDPSGYSYSQLTMLNRTRPKIFKDIIHVTQIQELTSRGYWAPVEYHNMEFNPLGLVLNSTGAEYTDSSVKAVVDKNNVNNRIYKLTKRLISEGVNSVLLFLDSVENCYIMANALGDYAAVIEANTPKKERDKTVQDFKSGRIKVVACVTTLSMGFDYPELQVVMMGRPTNSLAVFYQLYGRLVRPFEGKIGHFYDFGGNINKFGRPEDLTIENYNNYGWGVFSGDVLLTGKPMGGADITKSMLDNTSKDEFRNSNKRFFEFGKYKNVMNLDEIPREYLGWACLNAKGNMSKELYDECIKRINKPT